MTFDTSLTVTQRTLQLADLGPNSPLPPVQQLLEPPYTVGDNVPEDIADGARWGHAKNIYPYPLQDAYSRETTPTEVTAVVLENQHVKATFLPELGGRLWELTDKASGKELLHTGDRIQFANLALRNAWFAGGVEWNIGTRGHSPTTCEPLHSAIVKTPDGQEIFRMWEFDRLREVVFQIDAWLPADSKTLLVAVRIQNPNAETVPMYWWSNAAIPQTPQTRVIAPAKGAFATDYDGSMAVVAPTNFHGVDASWPINNPQAADFFFNIAPEQRRWEVAADADGDGLALVSTEKLRGRKLFVWGETVGGHRWQEWLTPSEGGEPRHYAEIQSGIAQTQFEHVRLGAGESFTWVEALGNAALTPELASGEWDAAVAHGEERVENLISAQAVQEALENAALWADLPPQESITTGHGWGALERTRRAVAGTDWIDETGTPFSEESLTDAQGPWLHLLLGDTQEKSDAGTPFAPDASFVRGLDWEALLARPSNEDAETTFHRAVMAHARASEGDEASFGEVEALYRGALADRALSDSSRALALRGLGLALLDTGRAEAGVASLVEACQLEADNRWLLAEAMGQAIANNASEQALDLVDRAPENLTGLGRIQFLKALALARSGKAEDAAVILKQGIEVADLREGENSITALWQEVCPTEDVPAAYQFSMH